MKWRKRRRRRKRWRRRKEGKFFLCGKGSYSWCMVNEDQVPWTACKDSYEAAKGSVL